jgi:hypothetical protein
VDIGYACKTIRAWNDLLSPGAGRRSVPGGLPEAVMELKRYLEVARGDGKPIRELDIPEPHLTSPEALRCVMPFVLSAESIAAHALRMRRTAMG